MFNNISPPAADRGNGDGDMRPAGKMPTVIPVAVMFLILAVLLVFMCLPLGQKTVNAVGGALDLRGEPMDKYVYALQGQWEFIYGEILTPEDFALKAGHTEIMELPSAWEDAGYPLTGCATYRLTIQADDTNPLMLYVPEISSAYALWVNGALARNAGAVSEKSSEGSPLFENALVPLQAENGVVELVIQVSNYHFMQSSLTLPLLFGETDNILSRFFRTRALYCVALGCILMAAFYHLALYIFRRREKVYLLFALMCALCFTRFIMETNGINQYLQWIPLSMFGIRLYLVLLFLHTLSVVIFSLYVFDRGFLSRHKYLAAAITALGVILYCLMPLNNSWSLIVSGLVLLPFLVFIIVIAARSPVLRRDKWTRLFFAALLLYISWGFGGKLFFESLLYMPGLLVNIFMIMAQSLVLSRSYAEAFELVEETNEALEEKVAERTAELLIANNQLAEHNVTLDGLNRMKTEFLQDMSHEMKSPLTVIATGIDFADGEIGMEVGDLAEARSALDTVREETQRLGRMVNGMISLAAMSGIAENRKRVDFAALLGSSAEAFRLPMEKYNNTLRVKIEPGLPDVFVEHDRFAQVMTNLLSNAAGHTRDGQITVTADYDSEYITVGVADTGEGVPPDILPNVFKRGVSGRDGTGYGLYICKTVVEAHGGTIKIESEPGKGTTVTFTVPVYGGQEAGHRL